jgi:hypothetical protein
MPIKGDDASIDWLMEGDPAIRWQCVRDLLHTDPAQVSDERSRIATEGWGARLLALQDPEGTWAGGLYTPKWTSTFYTMLLLRSFGLGPAHAGAARAARILLDRGFRTRDGGLDYGPRLPSSGRGETCITGMGLAILAYFNVEDDRLGTIATHLLDQQMADGGWNCQYPRGATHASFHTTISALEGLLEWERFAGRSPAVEAARRRGEEFLLVHRLFRSHTTGAVVHPALTRLSFPPRWHYDVLRALDYFRESGAERDPRLGEAVALVQSKRLRTGGWPLQQRYAGTTFFEMETAGKPSRWNTLRALRVLAWWGEGLSNE